jgi:hypothetical protein
VVIADLLLILLLGGVILFGLSVVRAQRRENKVLAKTPVVALERSSEVYKIAQTSTRLLERLMDDDMVACTIPESTQERIKAVIDDFYGL